MFNHAFGQGIFLSIFLSALAVALANFERDTSDLDGSIFDGTNTTHTLAKRDWLSSLLNGYLGSVSGTALTALQQNGNSLWGTQAAKQLPLYQTNGDSVSLVGLPWGKINCNNSNPFTSAPNTGVTRKYNFVIAPCTIAPDGVKDFGGLCVNGQFPGPLIEANYGDMISVTVTNGLKDEGTAMHWHGLLQTNTNWQDGVPGVTQCPIAPGASERMGRECGSVC